MWNCWPERYGKFQSEIPSTSGAICEKPQGGPFGPPPAGRGLNLTEFQLSAIAVHPFTHVSWGGRVGLAEVMN